MRTRRIFLVVPLLLALGAVAAAPASAKYIKHHVHARIHKHSVAIRVAPADEYFGRLKLSILGIRNQLHDLDMRLQYAPDKGEDVLGSASFVEDALHDWEHKYPADPWLAKDVFQLTQLYSHVHTDNGDRCANRTLHWLLARYGKTPYARQARTEITIGMK